MKVEIRDACYGDMKIVTFSRGETEHSLIVPAKLAKIIEIRLNVIWQFKHGIIHDGKELIAMFKDAGDRNVALSELDATEPGRLTAFSVGDK